ncbi:MAG: DUF6460 domain-containing protein [Hyphomicrobiaceae bacterium]
MDRNRVFGGNPLAVILRLAVLSVVVGVVMSALDIRPENLLHHLRLLFQRISALGFGAIESVFGYLVLGAVVVVPIWLVARLIGGLKSRDDQRPR